jgi:deoxycytidylate deaminase
VQKQGCPACGNNIGELGREKTLLCPRCGFNLAKHFFPFKGAEHCTALHAEERALLNSIGDLDGAAIYTTTFPCLLCCKKIVEKRLRLVVYVEPYLSIDFEFSRELFERNKVIVKGFEGVKGPAFHSLFEGWNLP